ncbi:MAG TPA: hypothetical protein DDY62_00400 [Cryomorphaceae bacterium]|nr:hypothetical protein [Cryomorphaceae bacterium]
MPTNEPGAEKRRVFFFALRGVLHSDRYEELALHGDGIGVSSRPEIWHQSEGGLLSKLWEVAIARSDTQGL